MEQRRRLATCKSGSCSVRKVSSVTARSLTILLSTLIALLLVAGSGALYYVAAYQPNQLHAQATATSATATKGVVSINATGAAHTTATAQVQARVQAQATSIVVGTQIALQDVYNRTTDSTPTVNDSLAAQSNNKWDEHRYHDNAGNFAGSCGFTNGSYDVVTTPSFLQICQARATNFSNITYQVEMSIVRGNSGGITIRNDDNGSGYYFRISTDGKYILWRIAATKTSYNQISLVSGQSSAILIGNNQTNTLTIIGSGNILYLYVNTHYLNKASDSTYTSGQIGVYVDSDIAGAEATFHNAKVWKA